MESQSYRTFTTRNDSQNGVACSSNNDPQITRIATSQQTTRKNETTTFKLSCFSVAVIFK